MSQRIKADLVIANAGQIATMSGGDFKVFENHWIAIKEGLIAGIGEKDVIQGQFDFDAHAIIDGSNRAVIPGLVDCHTHVAVV